MKSIYGSFEPAIFRDVRPTLHALVRAELDRRGWGPHDARRAFGYSKTWGQDLSAWLRDTPDAYRFGCLAQILLAERLGITLRIVPETGRRRPLPVRHAQAVAA